jgi:predicted nucleotide-binding protein (sugar kinase/HSP70/actin superfamily)
MVRVLKSRRYPEFTKKMKEDYTIVAPTMLPIHFKIISKLLGEYGYNLEFFEGDSQTALKEGLKTVHNDICYPAMIVIGQLIHAIKSGKYDKNKTAFIITQTGGGCRASNYIHLLRKALKDNGFSSVPVISLNGSGLESHSGFKLSPILLLKLVNVMFYGDALMYISNQCKSYEKVKGSTIKVVDKWIDIIAEKSKDISVFKSDKIYKLMLSDFSRIELIKEEKIKVGIVGEIYMKYSPLGNNKLEEFLQNEGCEVVMSGVCDFFMYCLANSQVDNKLYGMNKKSKNITRIGYNYLVIQQKKMIKAIIKYSDFKAPTKFETVRSYAKGYINEGVKMGEGWLMTAEMLELIKDGVNNIVCAQPFGCLPNHIVGRGMVRKIMSTYKNANIVAIDYDPSGTKVNQENRIKLMLSNAKMNKVLDV